MNTGDEVLHPQWGRGTVLFDKPHCIGIRFLEHGQVNFSQVEWQAQKSPPERFRGVASLGGSAVSNLEYALESAIDAGDITEDQALAMYDRRVHVLEVKRQRQINVDEAYQQYRAHPQDAEAEEAFYKALLRYISAIVGRNSTNMATHYNIEDAISESAMEVWQRLPRFDPKRSSLKTWVNLITLHNIRDIMRQFRTDRGNPRHFRPSEKSARQIPEVAPNRVVSYEEEHLPSRAPRADDQLALKEFLQGLSSEDRTLVQMLQDGLTQQEIGEALNLDQSTVSRRIRRVRRALRA